MNLHNKEKMLLTMQEIITMIEIKDEAYGSSWMAHGGFSAFFNLDRKFSRIEKMAIECDYNLFKAIATYEDGVDTLRDLIAYALLILAETYDPIGWPIVDDSGEPGPDYVDQDKEK